MGSCRLASTWVACISLLGLQAIGCNPSDQQGPLPAQMPAAALYLQPRPHSRICVEVNTIEGAAIQDEWLRALVQFLEEGTDKRGRVLLARNPPIPLDEVKGLTVRTIAASHMKGPPDAGDGNCAYLHVLFYDSRLVPPERPFPTFAATDYPAICFDVREYPSAGSNVLRHEAGHLLGLVRNPSHVRGPHCTHSGCLMDTVEVSVSRTLLGLPMTPQGLCADCRKDLVEGQGGAQSNWYFCGPFLVRQEQGYWVASLPAYRLLGLGAARGSDWRTWLSEGGKDVLLHASDLRANPLAAVYARVAHTSIDKGPSGIAQARQAYEAALQDRDLMVRAAALAGLKELDLTTQPATRPASMP